MQRDLAQMSFMSREPERYHPKAALKESLMKSIAYLLDKKNLENMKKNVLTLRHKAISKENFYNSLMRLVT